jgi:hypothetical protein
MLCTCGDVGCDGKHPMVPFSEWATADKEKITDWWTRHPESNIGIHLGKSHAWVLDIDPRSGGDISFQKMIEQYGELPETRVVRTGSGGFHYYFAAWMEKIGAPKLKDFPGVDVKGNDKNQYVVAPPSSHYKGGKYEYVNRVTPFDAPYWLLDLLHKNTAEVKRKPLSPTEQLERANRQVPIHKLLTADQLSQMHREGNFLIGYHPIHKTPDSPREFSINLLTNRWHCWWHNSSGGLLELAAILTGLCQCEEFSKDNIIKPLSGQNFARSITAAHTLGISADDLRKFLGLKS